jgi:hypothetical protein
MLGPYTSASITPTWKPAWASATARLAATVDFPTPPLPDEIAIILPRFGWSIGWGAGGIWALAGAPVGGPWVALAGPAGLVTLILISSFRTPGTAATAARADRTSVAGSSGESRKVKVTFPSSLTVRSRIIPAERRSFSNRGF